MCICRWNGRANDRCTFRVRVQKAQSLRGCCGRGPSFIYTKAHVCRCKQNDKQQTLMRNASTDQRG